MSLLEELILRDNKIGSEGAQAGEGFCLTKISRPSGCRGFYAIPHCHHDGPSRCKALRSGKQLRRQALAPALKGLAALKFLYLSDNDLGHDGAKARRARSGS